MRRRMLTALLCAALSGFGTLAGSDVVSVRAGETLNDCFVRERFGDWAPGEAGQLGGSAPN